MWPFYRKPKPQSTKDAALQQPTVRCHSCKEKATFHLTWAENRRCAKERHFCENHAQNTLAGYKPPARELSRPAAILEGATEYELDLVVISEIHDQQVVYLREVGAERFFPMVIGIFEATAMDRRLKNFQSPRPLTHDVAANIVTTLGGELLRVLVDRFVDNHWCAQLCLLQDGGRLTVDIRPSDAFMFALLLERPIFFRDEALNRQKLYERFTDRARKVFQLATQEARRLNHDYIGTEHILLGLALQGTGVAANALSNLKLDLRSVRQEVEKHLKSGTQMPSTGGLPKTPEAVKVIEYSMDEAQSLNHNFVGTEHILLGLLREREGIVPQVLLKFGLTFEKARAEIRRVLREPE